MNYRHVYMRIISHAKQEMKLGLRPKNQLDKKNFPNQYFEFHHILPRSLFPLWIKRKSNIVPLTAREHFFCHQLLTKIYPTQSMYYALSAFNSNKSKRLLASKDYEKCRIASHEANQNRVYNFKITKDEIHQIRKTAFEKYWNNLTVAQKEERKESYKLRRKPVHTEKGTKNRSSHMKLLNREMTKSMRQNITKKELETKANWSPEKTKHFSEIQSKNSHFRNLTETEKKKQRKNHRAKVCKRILCVNDGKIFNSVKECVLAYGIPYFTKEDSQRIRKYKNLQFRTL